MMRKTKKFLLCSVSGLMMLSTSAQASDQMSIDEIRAQLQMLSQQVERLSTTVEHQNIVIQKQAAEIAAQKEKSADVLAQIQPSAGSDSDVVITMKPSPKIATKDGKYSFQPFGRVHLDAVQFDDDQFDHANHANFRRARIGFKGNLGENFKYKSEFDLAKEDTNFKEVTLTYTGLDHTDLKIGHQKPSFGMEQNTSSNYIMFLERSAATNAFTRDEEIGFQVLAGSDAWSLQAGVFNDDAGESSADDEQVTYDVRGSANLAKLMDANTDHVVHVGLGYSHRDPSSTARFSAKSSGDGNRVIDTGNIGSIEDINVYGAELAGVFGPMTFQGEYFNADVSRNAGNPDASFDGYHLQAAWMLTGEQRPYKGKTGNFGRIKPKSDFDLKAGTWGAWELLARYDVVDLNDASAAITGGKTKNMTVGANWYLNKHARLMMNIMQIDTDANAVVADDDPTVYSLRAQWDF